MKQLESQPRDPVEVHVDGMEPKGVVFIGKAMQMFDGTWRALADVAGCLCLVELKIKLRGSAE